MLTQGSNGRLNRRQMLGTLSAVALASPRPAVAESGAAPQELFPIVRDSHRAYITRSGEVAFEIEALQAGEFFEGRAAVQRPNGLWGYIDTNGHECIDARWGSVSQFSPGRASVRLGTEPYESVIDIDGNIIVGEVYFAVDSYENGVALATIDTLRAAFARALDAVTGDDYRESYIDRFGNELGDAEFGQREDVIAARDPLPLNRYGKTAFIDWTGRRAFRQTFDHATRFRDGLSIVGRNRHVGMIRPDGEYQVPPFFSIIHEFFSDGVILAQHQESEVYSRYDTFGRRLSSHAWLNIGRGFREGLAAAECAKTQLWGYISTTGEYVLPPTYWYAHEFIGGLARVCFPDDPGSEYYIDREGRTIARYCTDPSAETPS